MTAIFLFTLYFLYAVGFADICWPLSASLGTRIFFIVLYVAAIAVSANSDD